MCGIAGLLSHEAIVPERLLRMTDVIAHRRNEVDSLPHLAAAASGSLDLFKNLISPPGQSPPLASGADDIPTWSC